MKRCEANYCQIEDITGDRNARCLEGECAFGVLGGTDLSDKTEDYVVSPTEEEHPSDRMNWKHGEEGRMSEVDEVAQEAQQHGFYDPVADFEDEVKAVSAENVRRITGDSMAPAPGVEVSVPVQAKIAAILELMKSIHPKEVVLEDLPSFEQTLIGNYVKKLHLMISKQKGYGPSNITKGGLRGINLKVQDKLERAKTLVGDADEQIAKVRTILKDFSETATMSEDKAFGYISEIDSIVNPVSPLEDEPLENTYGDIGNYGDMGVLIHEGAWGKEMET